MVERSVGLETKVVTMFSSMMNLLDGMLMMWRDLCKLLSQRMKVSVAVFTSPYLKLETLETRVTPAGGSS
jgi:hypothetical protein